MSVFIGDGMELRHPPSPGARGVSDLGVINKEGHRAVMEMLLSNTELLDGN